MRLSSLVPVALGLGVALTLAWSPRVRAAEEKVKFDTVDQVELHGTFYPSDKGKKATTVLIVHKIGGSSQEDGWDGLAKELQKAGCSVLTFDLRGHGNSTSVDPTVFWKLRINQQMVKGYNPAKPPDTISYKDFYNRAYYPMMVVNDLAAAKNYLDGRNDAGDCNSSDLIVIGAEDGATLALEWLTSEQYRFRTNTKIIPPQIDPTPEGKDLSAAVWLTMSPTIYGYRAEYLVPRWLATDGKEKKQMGFLYGAEDSTAAGFAKKCVEDLKEDKKKQPFTVAQDVPNTKLAGQKLLTTKKAPEMIVHYINEYLKENNGNGWSMKDVERNSYVWKFGNRIVPAKAEMQKDLNPIPTEQLGVNP